MSFYTQKYSIRAVALLCFTNPHFNADLSADSGSSEAPVDLAPYVVTTSADISPLETVLDPTLPAQPLPAQDGADVLKNIPGISVIRKGGTDGDPTFRGMAGSRLGIRADGQICLGGCGSRMDPPTAYIFPAAYDSVRLLKGPQTVLYGPGQSAGVVLFENVAGAVPEDWTAHLTIGSWGRFDFAGNGTVSLDSMQVGLAANSTRSDDYEDGDGISVHSAHERWSVQPSVSLQVFEHTLIELGLIRSDGEAAYADRMMDGVKFDRTSYSLRTRTENISPLIDALEFELGHNYVDHVMDNYSLREFNPSMMMPNPTVSNPDRSTLLAKAQADLVNEDNQWKLSIGMDHQADTHQLRSTMNATAVNFENLPRMKTGTFKQWGLFAEASYAFNDNHKVVSGLRLDSWNVEDQRAQIQIGMMAPTMNPTSGEENQTEIASGFLRWEGLSDSGNQYFIGIGHVARFPDYWELFRYETLHSPSAFAVTPEYTTQLDLGTALTLHESLNLSLSGYFSSIEDFILIESGIRKPAGMMGTRSATVVRQIEARTLGLESTLTWQATDTLQYVTTLAYARGTNQTDALPLAQMPPLEGTVGVRWERDTVALGAFARIVDAQNRVAPDQGNIVGQDIGPSNGFATLSINGSWKLSSVVSVAAGIDNLFDKTYAEHLSRAGSALAGYIQTTRVNEPGRTFWMRIQGSF
jgi:iron complex outermembrane receptor protein